ncbi:cytidine deaminase [Aurantiacibacter sp. D1-12]|uniref:cytidine deaminase n=1 Tax=Aurantiacibacter sp. D1-12 TaxID=2993658 RepID=UPI00237D304F|nr:cytidine deaminase [Aurantiacibacter sp. D1-12]MDE1466201.1 cytidine deaminase [Aurantiacibacter sp. D1-12]
MSDLLAKAKAARLKAHAPYSGFFVGAAVESIDGEVAVGANMENACYRLGVCAEQSALTAAQQAFGLENVARVLVVGGPEDESKPDVGPVTPCGGCRQAIAEAAQLSGRNIEIVCCDRDGGETLTTSIADLLPSAFSLD